MGPKGLGKPRSRLGSWLDSNGIKQEKFREMTGLNRDTISTAANDDKWIPRRNTAKRIMNAVNTIEDGRTTRDFWDWIK